ncbi:MAG: D-aminoacyl-tRNA deacylase [Candidatus Bathyarchaeia archaeon]
MKLVVASKSDIAGQNIAMKLIKENGIDETSKTFHGNPMYRLQTSSGEANLLIVQGELVKLQELSRPDEFELIVFVSRHESRDSRPILSVHVPGNLGDAEFGGLPRKLSIAPANSMCMALKKMAEERVRLGLKEFEIYYEGTHHGPSLDVPCLFVEIGSTIKEWSNSAAGTAVARAAIAALECSSNLVSAVGIGGSHCNRRLTRLSLESHVAFGHIIPSYHLKLLTPELIQYCAQRMLEKDPIIVLDWKGIDGKDRDKLQKTIANLPYHVRRVAEYI